MNRQPQTRNESVIACLVVLAMLLALYGTAYALLDRYQNVHFERAVPGWQRSARVFCSPAHFVDRKLRHDYWRMRYDVEFWVSAHRPLRDGAESGTAVVIDADYPGEPDRWLFR